MTSNYPVSQVNTPGDGSEIFNSVVSSDPVDVVHIFGVFSKDQLIHNAMTKDRLPK